MISYFTAVTTHCVCQMIRSVFRVLGIYNFAQRFLSYLISHFLFFSQLDGYFFLTSLNVQINLRVSTTVRKSHAENRSALLTQKVVKQIAAYAEK